MNKFSNIEKMIQLGYPSWDEAGNTGLLQIRAKYTETNQLMAKENHRFINMCSCSYLGLDKHPKIIEGAINAVNQAKVLILPTSRTRIGISLLDDVEDALSDLFQCDAIVTISCAAASAGVLPILASGVLTGNKKPLMVFDKQCHFSMNLIKAICGDETELITCEHNDINTLEDLCKKNNNVVYIADGAYSMGGYAPVQELKVLQEKYGLFLYFDDSHAIAAYGKNGVGYVRDQFDELNDRTIIVGSLAKAFGASGGIVMLNNKVARKYIDIFGGPLGWSQSVNTASMGAILASVNIHKSEELPSLQNKLQENLNFFDQICPTVNSGNGLPIRVIEMTNPKEAIYLSGEIYKRGFYTSAVFFPIVAKNRAGLRVMARADLSKNDIQQFCNTIDAVLGDVVVKRNYETDHVSLN